MRKLYFCNQCNWANHLTWKYTFHSKCQRRRTPKLYFGATVDRILVPQPVRAAKRLSVRAPTLIPPFRSGKPPSRLPVDQPVALSGETFPGARHGDERSFAVAIGKRRRKRAAFLRSLNVVRHLDHAGASRMHGSARRNNRALAGFERATCANRKDHRPC